MLERTEQIIAGPEIAGLSIKEVLDSEALSCGILPIPSLPSHAKRRIPKSRMGMKAICVGFDLSAVVTGLALTYLITGDVHLPGDRRPTGASLTAAAISLPIWIGIFARYRLYNSRFLASRPRELNKILHAVLASVIAMTAISFLLHLQVSRSWLIVSFFVTSFTCVLARQYLRWIFDHWRKRGVLSRIVLLAGGNAEAQKIYRQLRDDPRLGYSVAGLLLESKDSAAFPGPPVLGTVAEALDVARALDVTGIIVATTALSDQCINRVTRELTENGYHVELSSSLAYVGAERLTVRPLGYYPMIYIEPVRSRGWRAAAKRAHDIVLASLALLFLWPLFGLVMLLVRLDSKGPVFFRQVRVGRHEKPFRVLKFRTMVSNAEELLLELKNDNQADGPLFKLHNDPRVTRVGTWLRRYSIDELPQIINVLCGQMSIVGPRPALYSEMDEWTDELRVAKLQVRPGLTGIWQVSGRSNLSFEDYVRLDLFYVQNWSLLRDMAIIFRTFPVVLNRQGGAY
jgi:exopolysaccharide biosynthesis polyprenyl glycosylphosphotransferase